MSRTRAFMLILLASLTAPLAISSCGGGGGGSSPTEPPTPSPSQVVVVQVRDFSFDPKSVTIQPGDTVRWIVAPGSDRTHTVTARDGSFDSGKVFNRDGATFERRFDTAGTWEYWCSSHRDCCSMQGSVRVGSTSPPPIPGYE